MNPPPHIHVHLDDETRKQFIEGYMEDPIFKSAWEDPTADIDNWIPGRRYFKNEKGLLFFRDADHVARLCIPLAMRNNIIKELHESPWESSHASPERMWKKLSSKFYWKRMRTDILNFCRSCDICQKAKPSNFSRFGYLIPHTIPTRPYESVSMDFIVNLPMSLDYNAVLVVVDRLTKHATFIPTDTGLDAEGFADLFLSNIIAKYGLPDSIICDRDPRWANKFWTALSKQLGSRNLLSSSHHPQHDGQTEVLNKYIGTLLRTYIKNDRADWASWLHAIEFAYNSSIHSSTGYSPFFLLRGFEPKTPSDFLLPVGNQTERILADGVESYLSNLQMHRENARLAIAKAQDEQAKYYNRGRRPTPRFKVGDRVLVNPHSLEWVEAKGDGKKLVQRWIGPFEVMQEINPNTYRLRMGDNYQGFPVFNFDHLKPYNESDPAFGERILLPDPIERKDPNEEYPVDRIIGHRWKGKQKELQFLVRWEGYGPQYDLWLTPRDMKNSPELISRYKKLHSL